jgi:23S rRNA (uridine2552-2'-O)-methyltransferase
MAYQPNDYYSKKAKEENYFARSVYKLQEIDEKYHVLKGAKQVMDLGASPGSWSQFVSKKLGNQVKIFAIDLNPLQQNIPHVTFVQTDILSADILDLLNDHGFEPHFDVVLSDMAPKTTGIRITDQARSYELCLMAFKVAKKILKTHGNFVCKMFDSEDFHNFKNELQKNFKKVNVLRPKSTRKESKEIFFIASDFVNKLDVS